MKKVDEISRHDIAIKAIEDSWRKAVMDAA
jgi:hypothetical protein